MGQAKLPRRLAENSLRPVSGRVHFDMSRILYFTRDYTPHDHRFLSALAATEHEIFALRLERRGAQLEDRPLPAAVTQIVWEGGQQPADLRAYPRLLRGLKRVIGEVKPDLIHAGPLQSAAFLAALSGFSPLVSMSWGSDLLVDAESSAWMKWATRQTLQRTTVLAGDCQAVRNKAAEFGFPAERVVLFPWGVDLTKFTPPEQPVSAFRQRLGWDADTFVVLSLRSWEPLYGVHELVRGFAAAARQVPQLRMIFLGGGSQAAELRRILLNAGVLDQVYFGGRFNQDDLPAMYQAADVYVSASHSDGSSVSLMEALASGLPVLVSDIPGNLEWITPGQEGWFFPTGDWRSIAAGILNAYEQRSSLAEMGRNARRLAEQRADWTINFQRLLQGYQMALELHTHPGAERIG